MCGYRTLHNNEDGYVICCDCCGHIQVAFGTTVTSFNREEFYEHISLVDDYYNIHNLSPFRNRKEITLPTVSRTLSLVYSVNELDKLLKLLVEGRNKLEYDKLFVFNEN